MITVPGWVARGLVLAIALVPLPYGVIYAVQRLPSSSVLPMLAAYAVLFIAYVWFWVSGYRRRNAWLPVTAVLVVAALVGTLIEQGAAYDQSAFILPVIVAGYSARARTAIIAVAAVAVIAGVKAALTYPSLPALPTGPTIFVVNVTQLMAMGLIAVGIRIVVNMNNELRRSRETLARMAVDEERNRIARDMHDVLGRSLSLITLKGELTLRLARDPDRVSSEVSDIVREAREALNAVREVVSGYRQPTLSTELAAARSTLDTAGVALHVNEGSGALTRDVESLLGWAVREGTTNLVRHTDAKNCEIVISRDVDGVILDVIDDGHATKAAGNGSGLKGLSERAAALHGSVEAGRLADGRYRLRISVPVASGVKSEPATSATSPVGVHTT